MQGKKRSKTISQMRFTKFNSFIMKLLVLWVIVLSILYSTLSIVRHNHYQSGGFDLGLYDQAVWRYSRFLPLNNTVKERHILGDHLTLTLPLLSPLFWIWNDVRMLLVFQAAWISASSIAIYLLARHRKLPPVVSFTVSVLYSLFYGVQYAIFFDFHPVVFGVGLIAWLLYFFETKQKWFFGTTLILVLATQENMGLMLAAIGFIYVFQKQWRKPAILFIIGGVIASLLAAKTISLFSPVGFQYAPQIPTNPVTILTDFFNAPEKREVWLYTMSWFSLLPLLSIGAMLGIFFDLAQYFVTGPEFARMWSPFMHHRISLAPIITFGTIEVLVFLKSKKISLTVVAGILLLSALTQQYLFHLPINKLIKSDFWKNESWIVDNDQLIETIPHDMKIATQQSLIPHLSHRKDIYLFWPRKHDFREKPCGETSCWWIDFNDNAEYLLVDVHPNIWLTMLLETPEHVREALTNMEKMEKITLVKNINDAYLYKIN